MRNYVSLLWSFLLVIGVSGCPRGYDIVGNKCYTRIRSELSWEKSALRCARSNSRLAFPADSKELRELLSWLGENESDQFWISGKTLRRRQNVQDKRSQVAIPSLANGLAQNVKKSTTRCLALTRRNRHTDGDWTLKFEKCRRRKNVICQLRTDRFRWTQWYSRYNPGKRGDRNLLRNFLKDFPEICPYPMAVECRKREPKKPWKHVNRKLLIPCILRRRGRLVCKSKHQTIKKCPDVDVRFKCPEEFDECMNGYAECPRERRCVNIFGHYKCEAGKNQNSAPGVGRCIVYGDPHHITFDGYKHDVMGTCKYLLTKLREGYLGDIPFFVVIEKSELRRKKGISFLRHIEVLVNDHVFTLRKLSATSRVLMDDEVLNVPYEQNLVKIFSRGKSTVLKTDFGLEVSFDGKSRAEIVVPEKFMGKLSGICGDFDGNSTNDFRMPNGSEVRRSKNRRHDSMVFGNSWTIADDDENCPETVRPVSSCDMIAQLRYDRTCSILKNKSGPFAQCISIVDPEDYISGCTFDMCEFKGEPDVLCDVLQAYAEACLEKRVPLGSWRNYSSCIIHCPKNSRYSTETPGCTDTCLNPNAAQMCTRSDTEGCVCNEGYISSDNVCVPKSECGCQHEGKYYKANEIWVNKDCSRQYQCRPGAKIAETKIRCHENAKCKVKNFIRNCYCKSGFTGDGINFCKPQTDTCPKGFAKSGKKCFMAVREQVTWEDAALRCASYDAHLAYPDSRNDLVHFPVSSPRRYFWISGRQEIGENKNCGNNCRLPPKFANKCSRSEKTKDFCLAVKKKLQLKYIKVKERNVLGRSVRITARCQKCTKKHEFVCEIDYAQTQWSGWRTSHLPNMNGFLEDISRLREKFPEICYNPSKIECRCNSKDLTLGDFKCQRPSYCDNFQVRYKCPSKDVDECTGEMHFCDRKARCVNTFEHYKCVCRPNHVQIPTLGENKGRCSESGVCSLYGGHNVVTFDRENLKFRSTCPYVLAKTRENSRQVNGFSVVVRSFVTTGGRHTTAEVNVENGVFQFGNYTAMVNGVTKSLPFKTGGVYLQLEGPTVTLTTDFGLTVSGNRIDRIIVQVPKTYQNKLRGLCGNFDDNAKNDLRLKNGRSSSDPRAIGQSWQVKPTGAKCVTIPANEQCRSKNQVRRKCRILKDRSGPFSRCHSSVDVRSFFANCLTTTCADRTMFCLAAEAYAKVCEKVGVSVTWKRKTGCFTRCPENSVFVRQAPACTETCLAPRLSATCKKAPTESCRCKNGYVFNKGKCIHSSGCGCVYDGRYYRVGDAWLNADCSQKMKCTSSADVKVLEFRCHRRAVCLVKNGIRTCDCRKGFAGDGVKVCAKVRKCNGKEYGCTRNAQCYRLSPSKTRCICKKGFISKCNECVDIDECDLGTYKCRSTEKCVNTPGSYVCACLPGYEKSKKSGHCYDVDECAKNMARCPQNSVCSNRIGSYRCVCCGGYEMHGKRCTRIKGYRRPKKCCPCLEAKCFSKSKKICGSDGKSYRNFRALIEARCNKDRFIAIEYKGRCQKTCQNVECREAENCVMVKDKPKCRCRKRCTKKEKNSGPVCSDKNYTYRNMCAFRKRKCRIRSWEKVKFKNQVCKFLKPKIDISPWSKWSECNVTCGIGNKKRGRRLIIPLHDYEQEPILSEKIECVKTSCPRSPCSARPCRKSGQVCDDRSGKSLCRCPNCQGHSFGPVCAVIGNSSSSSFIHRCQVKHQACVRNEDFLILHRGQCGTHMTECSVKQEMQRYADSFDCISERMVTYQCTGTCGRYTGVCCRPKSVRRKRITLKCQSGQHKMETIKEPTECECAAV